MQLKWKHFWAALGYVVTCGWATLPVLWDAPVVGVVGAVVTSAGVVLVGRHEAHAHPLFRQWRLDARRRITQLLSTGAGAHLLWVLAFEQRPQAWPAWLAALLAVSGAEVGVAEGLEYLVRREQRHAEQDANQQQERARPVVPQQQVEPSQLEELPPEQTDEEYAKVLRLGEAIFRRAQLAAVEIHGWHALSDTGVTFDAQIPDMASQSKHKKSQVTALSTSEHGEALAIAAGRQLGRAIESSWVQVYKQRQAGAYTVSVLTRDALADVHPYVDDPHARPSIKDPCDIGWRADQQQVFVRLDQNGFATGKSQSGKSSFEHRKFARVTQCYDAVQWVCGMSKVYDLVADWIEPYEDTDVEIPINWIAYGPRDTAEMLAAGLRIARDRQSQRKSERTGWKAIKINLDECSDVLKPDSGAWAKLDGKRRHASDLYAELSKTGKSGWVYVDRDTQYGVQNEGGTHGGMIQATTDITVAFQTNDPQDIGRAVGDFKTAQPPHAGCYWIKRSAVDAPEMAKNEYLQESDPSKPVLHGGQTIRDIAWSRRDCDNTLDERAQAAAGPAYHRRHRFMGAALMGYLRPGSEGDDAEAKVAAGQASTSLDAPVTELPDPNGFPEDDEDDPTPEGAGREEAHAALAGIPEIAAMLSGGSSSEAAAADADSSDGAVTELPRQSRAERIVQIAQDADEPLTRGEILTALREDGDEPSEQVVSNALGRLVKRGTLVLDQGTYAPAELATAQ